MTHFNNWGEIPEELQLEICDAYWQPTIKTANDLLFIAKGELFQWAITQGLINKPEPVEGWFVPKKRAWLDDVQNCCFHPASATPLIKNPDGTYSEVKTDE